MGMNVEELNDLVDQQFERIGRLCAERDALTGTVRAYEQSFKNLSADCDTLARRLEKTERAVREMRDERNEAVDRANDLAAQLQGPGDFGTWRDAAVDERVRRVAAEKREQALAAHVEALQEKQLAETCACSHDHATDVCLGHSPMLRAERERADALAANVERIRSEFEELTDYASYETLLDTMGNLFNDPPAASLARLKAEWKADVLESEAAELSPIHHRVATHLIERAAEIRQASGDDS